MSELRQYHPNFRVLQIKQTKNGWIFIGDTPKDFAQRFRHPAERAKNAASFWEKS